MKKNEIITLQLGSYANKVASYYWNLQEFALNFERPTALDTTAVFRFGTNFEGRPTYSPRAVSIDFGSASEIRKQFPIENANIIGLENEVSENKNEIEAISQSIEAVQMSRPNERSSSAIFSGKYHEKSFVDLFENADNRFISYDQGYDHFRLINKNDAFSDSVRFFAEECDNFQGFQFLSDIHDGYSGLSSRCLEDISDDYRKKTILAYPMYPSSYTNCVDEKLHLVNTITTYNNYRKYADLIVPMSYTVNGWKEYSDCHQYSLVLIDENSLEETSAVLALALHTLWLPLRKKDLLFDMKNICVDLNVFGGRKMAVASLELPFAIRTNTHFDECLRNRKDYNELWNSLISPICDRFEPIGINQIVSLCGVNRAQLKNKTFGTGTNRDADIQTQLNTFYLFATKQSQTKVFHCEESAKIKKPFPDFFHPNLNEFGFMDSDQVHRKKALTEVPVFSGFHAGSFIQNGLLKLHSDAKKIVINQYRKYYPGMDRKVFREILNGFMELHDSYY